MACVDGVWFQGCVLFVRVDSITPFFNLARVLTADALLPVVPSEDLRLSFVGFLLGLDGDVALLFLPAGDARATGSGTTGNAN